MEGWDLTGMEEERKCTERKGPDTNRKAGYGIVWIPHDMR